MWVISTDDVLELHAMRPHQELVAERLVQIYQPELDPVTFVSHEWSGLQHPDPQKKQLYALQKALRGFRDHSLKLIYDPVALMRRYQKNVGYSDLQEMAKGWLWIDFMCIPQECACWSDEAKQEQEQFLRDAIRSLHTYVAHSSFFLILAPAQHHEKGRLMDYTSWKSRGWCQFELTVNVLMGGRAPVIMVQGLGSVKKVSPRIFLHFAPCLAEFTKEEDKLFISDALDQVINAQVAHLRTFGEVHRLQMLECLRALLTRRTGDLTLFKRLSRTGSLAYMASRAKCVTYKGWTQLHYAAARSDKEAVTRMLGICECVEAQTRQSDRDLFLGTSLTPLHMWAAFSFNADIAKLLLQAHALVDRRASEGLTPLMIACRTGNTNACRTLLEMIADPNAEDCMGCRPLTFALANDAEHLVEPLLNARADVTHQWAGLSALHFLGLTSSANSLERLLGEGLEINTVCHFNRWSKAGPYMVFGQLRSSTLRRLFSLGQGSTPVLAAAALGNAKVVETLSRAGADMTARNAAGLDIHQICRISCIPESVFSEYKSAERRPSSSSSREDHELQQASKETTAPRRNSKASDVPFLE